LASDDPRRAFLARLPEDARSVAANLFLRQVRVGLTDPAEISRAVVREVQQRVHNGHRSRCDDVKAEALLVALNTHPAEAKVFAAWCRWWELLPSTERARLKDQRSEQHRQAWLAHQPPTAAQLGLLARLGCVAEPASKGEASTLIDRLLQQRKARA
jgi:hypothetical protein